MENGEMHPSLNIHLLLDTSLLISVSVLCTIAADLSIDATDWLSCVKSWHSTALLVPFKGD